MILRLPELENRSLGHLRRNYSAVISANSRNDSTSAYSKCTTTRKVNVCFSKSLKLFVICIVTKSPLSSSNHLSCFKSLVTSNHPVEVWAMLNDPSKRQELLALRSEDGRDAVLICKGKISLLLVLQSFGAYLKWFVNCLMILIWYTT